MRTVTVHEAQMRLSRLIEDLEAGEEITIARSGKPVAKLCKVDQPSKQPRTPGAWKGKVWMAPDMAEVDDQITRLFEGQEF